MKAALVLAATALAASSCGGGRAPAGSAADVAPRATTAFLTGRVTPRLLLALRLLPGAPEGERLAARARRLTGPGGGQVAFVGGFPVGFDRPSDGAAFERRLDAAGLVHARVLGWTVYARSRSALDAVRRARAHLSGASWYRRAHGELTFAAPAATVVVDRSGAGAIARWTTVRAGVDRAPGLAARIPGDATAAVSFADGRRFFAALPFADRLRAGLGLRVADLAAAAPGAGVLFARPGTPVPAVTLLAADGPVGAAGRIVRSLEPGAPPALPATLDGVPIERVSLGAVDLSYGRTGTTLVLTDDDAVRLVSPVAALRPAGLPGAVSDWAYLDVAAGLPGLERLAELAGAPLSRSFVAKLAPLRTVLAFRTHVRREETLSVVVMPR